MCDIIAYTDGGCRGNPGIGAWAYLLIHRPSARALEQADGERQTTNNRMELTAVLKCLQALTRPDTELEIRSDSKYTIDCCEKWLPGWKRNGWRRKGGPLKNVDLLQELDALLARHRVRFRWVKGHAGEVGNEYVDGLLNRAMDQLGRGAPAAHHKRRHFQLPT